MTEKEPIVMLCQDGDLKDLKRTGLAAEEKGLNPPDMTAPESKSSRRTDRSH